MSKLLLCNTEDVKNPYPVRELGICLHSKEELAYYIYNYLFLIENDFLGEQLMNFIRDELKMPKLEAKLRKWSNDSSDITQVLFMLLTELHYCNDKELAKFREELEWMKKAMPSERRKKRGDYMLGQKKYAKAIVQYDSIMAGDKDAAMTDGFLGSVFHNKAMANAGLFEYEKAMNGLIRAYDFLESEEVLKEMYFLCLLSERKEIPDVLVRGATGANLVRWKSEYDELLKKQKEGTANAIRELEGKDSIRRKSGVNEMMITWKQQYREMARL